MTQALRVAVAGAGYFSQFHYDGWSRLDGVELAASCDRDAVKAQAMADRFGIPRAFQDVEAMLDAVEPDLLDIVTPPTTHLELVQAAARRGIPMICQKPLAPTLAEAEAVVEAAEAAATLLVVHENFRFMPWFREAARLLADGRLGTPHSVAFRLRPGDGQGPRAYLDRQPYFQQMERFLIHETAIHFIDTYRFMMGEIVGVFARLRRLNPVIAGEDAGYMLFDFASGATGLFDGNRLNDHTAEDLRLTMGEMWLEGSAGALRLDGFARLWWKPHREPEVEHAYAWEKRGFAGDCVRALQAHVVAHLREGAPLANTGREYLRNLVIEDAVYRSSAEGRWIDLG
jgi:predicted dehydrogenase